MDKLVSLAKRRGFIYPSSEIYGGFANSYNYGPYGVELKNNIKILWWRMFVHQRPDIVGLDGSIILHPKVWEASGHTTGFNDALVDCKSCKNRFRADHLIEAALDQDMEGKPLAAMDKLIKDKKIKCPVCKKSDWTKIRQFNGMFKTHFGTQETEDNLAYLRPETAQAIFVEYKNIIDTMRVKIPFGIAQIGKAFRNEITPGNFIFRTREFEQMEIEYFIREKDWKKVFEKWQTAMEKWAAVIGLDQKNLRTYEHPKEKLSHYSKKTIDIEYKFPFGFKELYGLAYRTDFDLSQHQKYSGANLEYYDQETKERFIPHVIEPTFGVDRTLLALLSEAYTEEMAPTGEGGREVRVVLKLKKELAPVKIAVLPLSKKVSLNKLSKKVFDELSQKYLCEYDETQSIGKRYRRQDEIGTPFCLTVDFESLEDKAVTIRDRDTMKQDRIKIDELLDYFKDKF